MNKYKEAMMNIKDAPDEYTSERFNALRKKKRVLNVRN